MLCKCQISRDCLLWWTGGKQIFVLNMCCGHNVAGTVPGLGAGRAGGYVPHGDKFFIFSETFKLALGPTQHLIQWVPRVLSVGIKITTHLHVLVRLRMSGAIPPLSLRAFIAWTGTAIYILFLWRCDPTRVMTSSFLRFLYHTQRRSTVGRSPLDEWSARRRDLYLTAHNTHNRQTSMPPVGFEPKISAGERLQAYALDRAATGTGQYAPY